jgi:lipopolysaccharide transport system permease protein
MQFEYARDLLVILTAKEVKLRYRRSWLGYVWSLAHPLAFAGLYFLAFGVFIRIGVTQYPVFLIAGLFPWQWVANSLGASPGVFLQNAMMIKKVRFPYSLLVGSAVLNDGIHFVCSLPVLGAILAVYGVQINARWVVGVPLIALAQGLMVYGLALGIASLNVFFRDLERLVGLGVTFLFFLTPIVYPEWMIPAGYRQMAYLNPVVPLIVAWRELLLEGGLDWVSIGLAYAYSGAALAVGRWVYHRLSWRLAEML